MQKNQWNSLEENKQLQQKKLFDIVDYACKNIFYYKNLNINYSYETIFEDIKKFPILNKQILKDSFQELKAENFNKKYYKNTS
jgi:phenylacetate-CoA ligase